MTLPEYRPEVILAEKIAVNVFLDKLGPLDVSTEEDVDAVTDRLREVKQVLDDLTARRSDQTRPLDAEKAKWMEGYKPLSAQLDDLLKLGTSNLTLFRKLVHEENERLAAQLENEAQRAAEDGRLDDAAAALTELDNVPVKAYTAAGSSRNVRWKAECESLPTLIEWVAKDIPSRAKYLLANDTLLLKEAQATHAPSTIPGVTFWAEEGTSIAKKR